MGKRTTLDELEKLVESFYKKDHGHKKHRDGGSEFTLYAVDCGGYDCDSTVTFQHVNGKFVLVVETKYDENHRATETKKFKFKLIEETS
jgi:hypothetical protein